MRDKIIGFVTAKLQDDDSYLNFQLVHKYAYEKNYGVVTYLAGMDWYDKEEKDIIKSFYMINFDTLDALIIDAFKIIKFDFIRDLCRKAENAGVPVVVINDYVEGCNSLFYNVDEAFSKILEHVLDTHGCKKVDLLLGFPHKWNSDILINIYKNNLEKRGYIYNEKNVAYGQYWGDAARMATLELYDYNKPDAIVCANDAMAMEAVSALQEKGIRVPEDVIITGIDGCCRSEIFNPTLTSIKKDVDAVIRKAFQFLENAFDGKRIPEKTEFLCHVQPGGSCGCVKDVRDDYIAKLNEMYEMRNANLECDENLYNLTHWIMQVSSIGDVAKALQENMPSGSLFCVKDTFLQDVFQSMEAPTGDNKGEKMYIIADSRVQSNAWASFVLKDTVPGMIQMLREDIPFIIVPVRYQDMHYGYWVSYTKNIRNSCAVMERFVSGINELFGRYIGERRLRFASSELFHANENVRQLQVRDIMTGMFNNNGFVSEVENLKNFCLDTNNRLVLACIDLDRLCNINDIYGHSEGDIAIQTLARIIQDSVDENDICGHLGSDEFIVASYAKDDDGHLLDSYFTALKNRVQNYNTLSGKDYSLEINYAYDSIAPDCDSDVKQFIDQTLNKKRIMKLSHRGMGNDNDGENDSPQEEREIVADIIDNNKFRYAYQPIVNAKNGEIFAYEALMRAQGDKFISPLTILNYATEADRLYEIEKATFFNVLGQVCGIDEQLGERKVFINSIPGYQLDSMDYAKFKRQFGHFFEKLVVEITEQTEMNDEGFGLIRKRSDKEGFGVAIDDFGSGYSNTSSLLKYLPNYVKIDRLLITEIQDDPKKQHFVKNIIEFAHDNGFMALAEGVETVEELRAVIHMGADLIQGYYTAKPAFDFIYELPQEVKHEILNANISGHSAAKKKMFVVNKEKELLLMRLALEQYTGILVSQPELTIVGNPEFAAGMCIKVRDDCSCTIRIRNVVLSSDDESPTIDVGKNSTLRLILEENNELKGSGIHVPETSGIIIEGAGNLSISAVGAESFCIGNGWSNACGSIVLASDGNISLKSDGNKCICLGGGKVGSHSEINVIKGRMECDLSGVECLGIGYVSGAGKITIRECSAEINMQLATGIAIGSIEGCPDVFINNAKVEINGSGNNIAGIGSLGKNGCHVKIDSGQIVNMLNGRNIYNIGCVDGKAEIEVEKARIDITSEGNKALGIGSEFINDSTVNGVFATFNITLRSAERTFLGAAPENVVTKEVIKNFVLS